MNNPTLNIRQRGNPALLLIALTIPIAFLTYAIAFFVSVKDLSLNSRLYPQILIAMVVVLLAFQIVVDVRHWAHAGDHRPLMLIWRKWRNTASVAAYTAVFTWAITRFGFYESLIPYVTATLVTLGVRRPKAIVLYVAGILLCMFVLFTITLGVRLPYLFIGL